MISEYACVFDCEEDELVGIVSPGRAETAVGVLIVVGGPQYRVGSHRQFRLLAEYLCTAGISVMRFDQRGAGDSTGEARNFERITPDIAAAVRAFIAACPSIRKVVLCGLCDGASASLLYWYATRDPRIAGFVLLNPWVRSEDSLANVHVQHYKQRLLQMSFWAQLLRGQVAVSKALPAIALKLMHLGHERSPDQQGSTFRTRIAASLHAFGGPLLIILSGRDFTAKEFEQYCDTLPAWPALMRSGRAELSRIGDADHTFSSAESRGQSAQVTLRWLQNNFCQPTP